MLQLDFFPRMEFHSLQDFSRLERLSLSIEERRHISGLPRFYQLAKDNQIIRKEHSELVDRILGFRMKFVEEMLINDALAFDPKGSHDSWGPALHNGIQTWVGLDVATLQTPYVEAARVFQLLKLRPYQQVVDLGAAYGRIGIVVGGLYPKTIFTGFEYVKSRVDEGNRVFGDLGFSHCELVQQDLFAKKFTMPEADIYFIYDFGQVEHISHTLNQLKEVASKRPIRIVVRGKYTKQIIDSQHPWLNMSYESRVIAPSVIYQAYLKN